MYYPYTFHGSETITSFDAIPTFSAEVIISLTLVTVCPMLPCTKCLNSAIYPAKISQILKPFSSSNENSDKFASLYKASMLHSILSF